MFKKRTQQVFALIFSICLIFCAFNLPTMAEEATNTITLGGTENTDPLKIDVLDNGRIGFYFWQNNGTEYEYQYQYYDGDCWGTNLFFTREDTDIHYSSDYYQDWFDDPEAGEDIGLGILVKSGNTVTGTWPLDENRMTFNQVITYTPGSHMYEKTFTLTNNTSDTTYSDLKIIHGGDAYFGGDDDSSSYWNEMLNMVYLRNEDMDIFGLMGFAGMNETPADQYFAGDYDDGGEEAMAGDLSNFADPDYIDAGYQLQWNRAQLAPGASFTVHSYEMITEPSALQIISPSAKNADPDEVVEFTFEVINFSQEERIVDLQVTSEHGWTAVIEEGAQVTLAPDGSKTITVRVTVPADATSFMVDNLTLTATDSEDPDSTATGSTKININEQFPEIVSVTPEHASIYEGTVSLNVAIVTIKTEDDTPIYIEFMDSNSNPLDPNIMETGIVTANGTTLSFTLPANLPIGEYKILATLEGAEEIKTANLSVVARPVITTVTPEVNTINQGEEEITIKVSTTNLPTGSVVTIKLLDDSKVLLSPMVTGTGQVAADGTVSIVLSLPDNMALGKYFIQASATDADDHSDSYFEVIAAVVDENPQTEDITPILPIATSLLLILLSGCYIFIRKRIWN